MKNHFNNSSGEPANAASELNLSRRDVILAGTAGLGIAASGQASSQFTSAVSTLKDYDGVNILIHNKGLAYPDVAESDWGTYRLSPIFTAPQGKYDWLNKSVFLSTLVQAPEHMTVAEGPDENDRLIQVHRVF